MDVTGPSDTADGAKAGPGGLLIVSQVRFLRESLAAIFACDGGWIILGMPDDLPGALALCAGVGPDVVLLDAAFPDGTGAIRHILDAAPGSRVVALALTETEDNVVAWAEAGAAGYVPSNAGLAELAAMLAAILDGAQTCSARVAAGLLRRIAERGGRSERLAQIRPAPAPPPAILTARERQIVGMIGVGMSNKEIARHLNIGVATTKSHVHNLLGKLNIQRRGQAASWIREHARTVQDIGQRPRLLSSALILRGLDPEEIDTIAGALADILDGARVFAFAHDVRQVSLHKAGKQPRQFPDPSPQELIAVMGEDLDPAADRV